MPDFSKRSYEKEIMDDMSLEGDILGQTLNEIAFINRHLGGNSVTISALRTLIKKGIIGKNQPFTLADLGCGNGDMLRQIALWARRRKLRCNLYGIDASEYTIGRAKEASAGFPEITYVHQDVFHEGFPSQGFDIVNCTLFCHHFTDEQLKGLFKKIRGSGSKALIVNDLHRHWLAYHSIRVLTLLFSKSHMVKNDAPLSVLRAFSKSELKRLLGAAGFEGAVVKWKWAFRYSCIAAQKP